MSERPWSSSEAQDGSSEPVGVPDDIGGSDPGNADEEAERSQWPEFALVLLAGVNA